VCVVGIAVLAVGCSTFGGGGRRPGVNRGPGNPPPLADVERDVRLMLSYDENSDGTVTRAELEAGLKRQFAIVDVNRDGRLDAMETRAENTRRQMANGTAYSPLIDWNQDGFVDFDEFATTARSVFDELDKNHDGVLSSDELRLPSGRGGGPGAGMQGGRGGRQGGGGGRRGP
jgi:hypothetical protein